MTTADDVWQLLAELTQAQKETDFQLKETDRQLKETNLELKELGKELGKQIGGLGQKFGSFTEGFALPSMDRILRERFGMETVSPRVRVRKNGEEM